MNLAIVFSKDRPLQLDACLSSFARHARDLGGARMVIVYAAASSRLLEQYREVAAEHATRAEFVLEDDFRAQVLGALSAASAAGGRNPIHRVLQRRFAGHADSSDAVLFLVDDALFVRPFSLAAAREMLLANPDALGFSLRLGRNTTKSYVLERAQELPPFESAGPQTLKFDWTKGDGDFGYPLEISSSLYRQPMMVRLMRGLAFSDPNTLESQLSLRAKRFRRGHSRMLCYETSVAFSAPLNRVQAVFENRVGSDPGWSTDKLAERFEEGERMDVGALDGFVPTACHQEIRPRFVKRTRAER